MASGEKESQAAFIDRQALRQAAFDADGEEPPGPVVERIAPREKNNVLAVRQPADDLIVRSHALGHGRCIWIKVSCLGSPPSAGHDVDVEIAVVLAGEGDPFAVRRKLGE